MDIDLSGPPDLTTLHAAVVKLVQGHQDHERRILESERVRWFLPSAVKEPVAPSDCTLHPALLMPQQALPSG